ncbi:MAG: hypothetical protein HUJ72_12415 [Blautia sp.]|nr:hypothetical protein [Blautia sp.]
MKRNNIGFTTIGIPSLFLIFTVLCLIILSLLTLGTSRSDLDTADLSLARTSSYYKACYRATSMYEDLQLLLSEHGQHNTEMFLANFAAKFDEDASAVYDPESQILEYQCRISDTLSLQVRIQILFPEGGIPYTQIQNWNTLSTGIWIPDTHQNVYKGE